MLIIDIDSLLARPLAGLKQVKKVVEREAALPHLVTREVYNAMLAKYGDKHHSFLMDNSIAALIVSDADVKKAIARGDK